MKNEILEFALALAEAAEAEIMPRFRSCTVNWKPDGSEPTDADRRAEEVMRVVIARHLPGHPVLVDEHAGPQDPTAALLWILDPVDRKTAFLVGRSILPWLRGLLE